MFESVKSWLKKFFSQPRKPVIKMYVLVRMDMPPIHRAVQAGHAVAAYLINRENPLVATVSEYSSYQVWNNGYMIYLGVKDESELCKWENQLNAMNKKFATFVEPDWEGGPTRTALACISFGEEFSNLPLLNMIDTHAPEPVFEQIHS